MARSNLGWDAPQSSEQANNLAWATRPQLGAIGSERRKMSSSYGQWAGRTSWLNEVGTTAPKTANIPAGPIGPDNLSAPKSRSLSFPQSAVYHRPSMPQGGSPEQQTPLVHTTSHPARHGDPSGSPLRLFKSPQEFVPRPPLAVQDYVDDFARLDISGNEAHEKEPLEAGNYRLMKDMVDLPSTPNEHARLQARLDREKQPLRPLRSLSELEKEDEDFVLSLPRNQRLLEAEARLRARNSLLSRLPPSEYLKRASELDAYENEVLSIRERVRRQLPGSQFPFMEDRVETSIDRWPRATQDKLREIYTKPSSVEETSYVIVTFKLQRAELYLRPAEMLFGPGLRAGELVKVEADRGYDTGTVWHETTDLAEAVFMTRNLLELHQQHLLSYCQVYTDLAHRLYGRSVDLPIKPPTKRIICRQPDKEYDSLREKEHMEIKARRIAVDKAKQHGLPMEVLDTELQADMQKLYIHFIAPQYVNFNDYVTDMYKLYKIRIWMSSVGPNHQKP